VVVFSIIQVIWGLLGIGIGVVGMYQRSYLLSFFLFISLDIGPAIVGLVGALLRSRLTIIACCITEGTLMLGNAIAIIAISISAWLLGPREEGIFIVLFGASFGSFILHVVYFILTIKLIEDFGQYSINEGRLFDEQILK